MFEDDVAHQVEIAVEQLRQGLRRDRVAELGEALEIGEQGVDFRLLAVQRELLGIAHDLLRDVGRQIFAERRLGEPLLLRADRARRRADADKGQQPAAAPAAAGTVKRIDVHRLQPEGKPADQADLHEQDEAQAASRRVRRRR